MQVFNTYFRLLNRKKGMIITFIGIFLGIAISITLLNGGGATEQYEKENVNISVIDRDKSELSKSLKQYLAESNQLVTIADNEKSIKDELYWRNVEYILIIPKDFQKLLEQGQNPSLTSKKIDGAVNAVYVDEEIKLFLSLFQMYQGTDYSVEEAVRHVEEDIKKHAKVDIVLKEDGENANQPVNAAHYYFLYLPYVLTCVFILSISAILLMFYQEDVKKRCICSSSSLKEQNKQLILANIVFCLAVTVLFIVIGIVVTNGELLGQINLLFYSINTIAFMFVAIALAFMLANLIRSEAAVNGCCNVFSLGFCFLGGVFVPLEIMPDGVVAAAHLVPTYWYVQANAATGVMTKATPLFLKEFFLNVGVELCFAIALFSVALMISKKRRVFS